MPKCVIYFDGQFVTTSADVIDVFTPGRQRLKGVFETIRVSGRIAESLDLHLSRLMAGLKILKIKHHLTPKALKVMVKMLLSKNPSLPLGRLRIMVFEQFHNVHCLAMVLPYKAPDPLIKYKVTVIKTQHEASSRYANLKSLDYEVFANAYAKAKQQGYDEALLLNRKGHVFEASRHNVFLILKNQLVTPPLSSGCLNGIVRKQTILAARRLGMVVVEKNITLRMIKESSSAFLTNSLAGVVGFVYN
jgi:branched-subunit amino acid aminotransferase/4-amino-4-deoxychorismate lyase